MHTFNCKHSARLQKLFVVRGEVWVVLLGIGSQCWEMVQPVVLASCCCCLFRCLFGSALQRDLAGCVMLVWLCTKTRSYSPQTMAGYAPALMWQYAFVSYLMRSRVYPTSACRHVAPF